MFRVAVAVCCDAVLSFAYGNTDAGAYEIGEDIAASVDNWVRIIGITIILSGLVSFCDSGKLLYLVTKICGAFELE